MFNRKKNGKMKKTLLYLFLAAGLVGCAKEIAPQEESAAGVPVTFEINVAETKAAKNAWADGDKIYVFFNGLADKYLIMTYSTSTGWNSTSGGDPLLDTDFSSLDTKTLTAVHIPVDVNVTYTDNNMFRFSPDVYTYYLFETGKEYTVDGATVKATLTMGKPERMVLFHVEGIQDRVADLSFSAYGISPVCCEGVGKDGSITQRILGQNERLLSGIADSDGAIFAGWLNLPDKEVSVYFHLYEFPSEYITITYEMGRAIHFSAGKMYNLPSLDKWRRSVHDKEDDYYYEGAPDD